MSRSVRQTQVAFRVPVGLHRKPLTLAETQRLTIGYFSVDTRHAAHDRRHALRPEDRLDEREIRKTVGAKKSRSLLRFGGGERRRKDLSDLPRARGHHHRYAEAILQPRREPEVIGMKMRDENHAHRAR